MRTCLLHLRRKCMGVLVCLLLSRFGRVALSRPPQDIIRVFYPSVDTLPCRVCVYVCVLSVYLSPLYSPASALPPVSTTSPVRKNVPPRWRFGNNGIFHEYPDKYPDNFTDKYIYIYTCVRCRNTTRRRPPSCYSGGSPFAPRSSYSDPRPVHLSPKAESSIELAPLPPRRQEY